MLLRSCSGAQRRWRLSTARCGDGGCGRPTLRRTITDKGTTIPKLLPFTLDPNWKTPREIERATESRHLLRSLLRECTYLPDSLARKYLHQHVHTRFAKFGFKVWEHRDDPAYGPRIDDKLREARKAVGLLRRANEGERKALLRVLLLAYGRIGKRRYELMLPLMPAAMGKQMKEALVAGEGEVDGMEDAASRVGASQRVPPTTRKPSAAEVNKGAWTSYVKDFSPQLRALLESQIRMPPPHLTRPTLRKLKPQIEELNAWLRPMPISRVRNKTEEWYADVLYKAHPPLPPPEWQRLRGLAMGTQKELMRPRRTALASTRESALDMLVMYGRPNPRKAFGNREAHQITPRFMRRLWAQVFAQCPVMDWDAVTSRWKVTWGEQALGGDDIPHILAMIKELAAHEHALDSVEATETSLLHTLTFAPSTSGHTPHTNPGYVKTLILRLPTNPTPNQTSTHTGDEPGAIAGMALYFPNYSTWRSLPGLHLEDLYVRPAYRGRGYGGLLIRALAQEVLRMGGGRLEWSCLKWNEGSLRFYEGLGARRMEGWVGLRLEGGQLEDVAEGRKMGGAGRGRGVEQASASR
ncbi:hypothetical protein LTR94_010297 [Friedmanniomyces endolithicus]|nr:hypothetical protein LTS09_015135 [Friedmanniomyces endolithicus]KAK0336045.1 hypothetical protein LTR94_010297 [Friedmanniomyces endolithicus]KAK0773000.1 hypothetical protein LTR75_017251 [Friedmanniomyces endolithicus]KAK0794973.1 hypothetical protein LTR38_009071 [Friedmanniomyces endolithicus]KAK0840272.1 hypothetical protein LTR03_010711 [Friedmanniomyces endolithicus]